MIDITKNRFWWLLSDITEWYIHVMIWCYLFVAVILTLILPGAMGNLLYLEHITWSIMPDWSATLWGFIAPLLNLLIIMSLSDMLQQAIMWYIDARKVS